MKLIHYQVEFKTYLGVLSQDEEWVFPLSMMGIEYTEMEELICQITDSQLQLIEHSATKDPDSVIGAARVEDIRILPPIEYPRQDIICIGKNYLDHAKEMANFEGEEFEIEKFKKDPPIFFSKRVERVTGDGDGILAHSDMTKELDYESELAIIIRKDARNIAPEEVKDYIFGYTIINDVSARDLQARHHQWFFAKSLDGFAPMGPVVLTVDSIDYPPHLQVKSYVNGECRQDDNTKNFIHSIDELVSLLSQGMTLSAGTIIATGTPSGVGMGFYPQKFLVPGDEVVCEIEGIGKIKNVVRE